MCCGDMQVQLSALGVRGFCPDFSSNDRSLTTDGIWIGRISIIIERMLYQILSNRQFSYNWYAQFCQLLLWPNARTQKNLRTSITSCRKNNFISFVLLAVR